MHKTSIFFWLVVLLGNVSADVNLCLTGNQCTQSNFNGVCCPAGTSNTGTEPFNNKVTALLCDSNPACLVSISGTANPLPVPAYTILESYSGSGCTGTVWRAEVYQPGCYLYDVNTWGYWLCDAAGCTMSVYSDAQCTVLKQQSIFTTPSLACDSRKKWGFFFAYTFVAFPIITQYYDRAGCGNPTFAIYYLAGCFETVSDYRVVYCSGSNYVSYSGCIDCNCTRNTPSVLQSATCLSGGTVGIIATCKVGAFVTTTTSTTTVTTTPTTTTTTTTTTGIGDGSSTTAIGSGSTGAVSNQLVLTTSPSQTSLPSQQYLSYSYDDTSGAIRLSSGSLAGVLIGSIAGGALVTGVTMMFITKKHEAMRTFFRGLSPGTLPPATAPAADKNADVEMTDMAQA